MAEKRSSWVVKAIKKAFASNPTPSTRVSRPRITKPDDVSSATTNQVNRDKALKKRGGSGGRA